MTSLRFVLSSLVSPTSLTLPQVSACVRDGDRLRIKTLEGKELRMVVVDGSGWGTEGDGSPGQGKILGFYDTAHSLMLNASAGYTRVFNETVADKLMASLSAVAGAEAGEEITSQTDLGAEGLKKCCSD